MDSIDLVFSNNKEYNIVKVFVNLDNFKAFSNKNENKMLDNSTLLLLTKKPTLNLLFQAKKHEKIDTIAKLYTLCIGSKSTQSVR